MGIPTNHSEMREAIQIILAEYMEDGETNLFEHMVRDIIMNGTAHSRLALLELLYGKHPIQIEAASEVTFKVVMDEHWTLEEPDDPVDVKLVETKGDTEIYE